MNGTNPRLMPWYMALQPYNVQIQYRKGQHHSNADYFSQQTEWDVLDQLAGLEGGTYKTWLDSTIIVLSMLGCP